MKIFSSLIIMGCSFAIMSSCTAFSGNKSDMNLFHFVNEVSTKVPHIKSGSIGFHLLNEENLFDWNSSNTVIKIDTMFYTGLQNAIGTPYRIDYQSFYLIGVVNIDEIRNTVLLGQRIHNDNEGYMYIVNLNIDGSIEEFFLVAEIYKSPDDVQTLYSVLNKNTIQTIRVNKYYDDGTVNCDSIISTYSYSEFKDYQLIEKKNFHFVTDSPR